MDEVSIINSTQAEWLFTANVTQTGGPVLELQVNDGGGFAPPAVTSQVGPATIRATYPPFTLLPGLPWRILTTPQKLVPATILSGQSGVLV